MFLQILQQGFQIIVYVLENRVLDEPFVLGPRVIEIEHFHLKINLFFWKVTT